MVYIFRFVHEKLSRSLGLLKSVCRIQIEIDSIEIGSREKQANRVGPLISGRFSLLFYD